MNKGLIETESLIKHRKSKSLAAIGSALLSYRKQRYSHMRRGWGSPLFHPLWLEAIIYAIIREWRFISRKFNKWCDEIDTLFVQQYGFEFPYTIDTGRDCWIESYVEEMTPQDAVNSEIDYWDRD